MQAHVLTVSHVHTVLPPCPLITFFFTNNLDYNKKVWDWRQSACSIRAFAACRDQPDQSKACHRRCSRQVCVGNIVGWIRLWYILVQDSGTSQKVRSISCLTDSVCLFVCLSVTVSLFTSSFCMLYFFTVTFARCSKNQADATVQRCMFTLSHTPTLSRRVAVQIIDQIVNVRL